MKNCFLGALEADRRLLLILVALMMGLAHRTLGQGVFQEQPVTFRIPLAEAAGTSLRPLNTSSIPCVASLGGFCGTSHELCDRNFGSLACSTDANPASKDWATLKSMATRLEGERQEGHEPIRLLELPADPPARLFAREVNPGFETAHSRNSGTATAGRIGFDSDEPGRLPRGWVAAITGEGAPRWSVVSDNTAPTAPNVLKQSGEVPKPSYPLCFKEGSSLQDGFVEVRFKTVSGRVDQAAGVVWRAQNPTNYYVCRANALEDNVVLYKVEAGQRKALDIAGRTGGYGVDTKVTPATWHLLRVEFAGSRFKVSLDGASLFEVQDGTFAGAGMVGLWTKADSVTLFDDFVCGGN